MSLQRHYMLNICVHCNCKWVKQYYESKILLFLIFKIAADVKPSYAHWYHHPGDLIDLAVMLIFQNDCNIDETCVSYFNRFNAETGFS